jgi:hypothetical protein
LVEPDADDDCPVESGVGLPVAAAVEPVAAGLAAAGWNRTHPTQARPGRFAAHSVEVVAGDNEQLCGGVGADTECLQQRR